MKLKERKRRCEFKFSDCMHSPANTLIEVSLKKGKRRLLACKNCVATIEQGRESERTKFKVIITAEERVKNEQLKHELTLEAAGLSTL